MGDHYGDLAGAEAYHELRGNDGWTGSGATDPQRTAALIRASSALDGQYGSRFPGVKTGGRLQTLAWPRTGARDHCAQEDIPNDEVPVEIINATYELALIELTEQGALTPSIVPGQVVQSEAIDGAVSVSYFAPGAGSASGEDAQRTVFLAVEDALRCILRPVNATSPVFGSAARA